MNTPGTNTGHGHVWKRPDGATARCGGPALCGPCVADHARLTELAPKPASLDFGEALAALKGGHKVTRAGWNGKGMFVVHQKGYPDGIAINRNTAEATGIPEGTVCNFRPYLMMRTVDGEFVPWVASQTDLLAEDWAVVQPDQPE